MKRGFKKIQKLFLAYKEDAAKTGAKNPGRVASNKIKALPEWSEVEEFIQHATGVLIENRLIGGRVCTECEKFWTSLSQQGICNFCITENPELKAVRRERTVSQRKATNLERYGHVNNLWNPETRAAITKQWGVENPMQRADVQAKTKATKASRYVGGHEMRDPQFKAALRAQRGYFSPFERQDVRDSVREIWRANGYDNPSQDPQVHQRKIETLLARAGVISPSQEDDYLEKVRATHLARSGGKFTHHMQDPRVLTGALRASFRTHTIQIGDRTFTVQAKAEEVVLRYLVDRYGARRVYTQFDEKYPSALAASFQWTPDFYVKGVGFVECKSPWTLCLITDGELEKNRQKAATTPCTWIVVRNKKHVVVLPQDWHTVINVPMFVECCYFDQHGSQTKAGLNRRILSVCKRYCADARLRDDTIFVASKRIAINVGHLYWDSTARHRLRDLRHAFSERQALAASKGWRLVRIWEHQWGKAAESYVRNLLGQSNRLYARKCDISVRPLAEVRKFLSDHHIQGAPRSGTAYCLDYGGKIVACMIFSRVTSIRGSAANAGFELARYASSEPVQGGASRLLKAFRKEHTQTIISYSDNQMFTGNMYEHLGFRKAAEGAPDYQIWFGQKMVQAKQATKRDQLARIEGFDPTLSEWENCQKLGLHRIYDSGKIKWVLE